MDPVMRIKQPLFFVYLKRHCILTLFFCSCLSSLCSYGQNATTQEIDLCTEQLIYVWQQQPYQIRNFVTHMRDGLRMGVARNLIKLRQFQMAKNVLIMHHIPQDAAPFVEIEWLIGFLDYAFLQNPKPAIQRWRRIAGKALDMEMQTKVCYWLGQALVQAGETREARYWLGFASIFPTIFYGQLSQLALMKENDVPPKEWHLCFSPSFLNPVTPTQAPLLERISNEIVTVLSVEKPGPSLELNRALLQQYNEAHSYLEQLAVLKAAYFLSMPMAIFLYKKWFKSYQIPSFLGYPMLNQILPDTTWNAMFALVSHADFPCIVTLAHAIILHESTFNPKAVSPKGAKGLTQLIQGTAEEEFAHIQTKVQIPLPNFDLDNLEDNLLLGISHIQTLMERFGVHVPLIATAYNAGIKKVEEWIKVYGDPRSEDIDVLTWLELIPFYETRRYVQNVIASFMVYSSLLNQEGLQKGVWALF